MPSSEQLTLSFEGGLDKMTSDAARATEDEKVHPDFWS